MPEITVRVGAIIVREGSILLARHRKCGREYFVIPGGHVEYGETLTEALKREILEETGLEIEVGRLALVADAIAPDGHRHVVNLIFEAKITGGKHEYREDDILKGSEFIPLEELKKPSILVYPKVKDHILALLRGKENLNLYVGNTWERDDVPGGESG